MCTLYVFTTDNKSAFIRQITADAVYNSDGFSVLIAHGTTFSLFRTENLDLFLDVITMSDGDRYFAHCRMATTAYKGITRCHGLDAGDYTIFHNGVIDYPGDLDSRGIAELFKNHPLDFALNALSGFTYANVIAVDTMTGDYYVNRSEVGSLHTDGNGSYSTVAIKGTCDIPVLLGYTEHTTDNCAVKETDEYDWLDFSDRRFKL